MRLSLCFLCTVLVGTPLRSSEAQSQDARQAALDSILREYTAADSRADAAMLVRLDRRIRHLVPTRGWDTLSFPMSLYRTEYRAIGVEPILFDQDWTGYSGKLLREAHRHDPHAYRSLTLYSTLFDADGELSNGLPDTKAAEQYLHLFPSGPFALEAHFAIGALNSDLFQTLRLWSTPELLDYKLACYKDLRTKEPLSKQRERVRDVAISHFRVLVRLRPDVAQFTEGLENLLQRREGGWYYCAD